MSTTFNAGEIFQIAIEIEKNGMKFYKQAAKMSSMAAVKEKFLKLAKMEEEHANTFTSLMKLLSKAETDADAYDPYDELRLYLNAFADGKIFDLKADPLVLLEGDPNPKEVINLAMNMEKDSIVFYVGIKELVSEAAGKKKVDMIIAQEMGHLRLLGEELESFK